MSTLQAKNFRTIKQIILQLAGFGLNPYEWRIERDSWSPKGEFYICHRTDKDFRMNGRWEAIENTKTRVLELKIASI